MDTNKELNMEEATKKLAELSELENTSSLLKNNYNEFTYKEKTYKIHQPTAFEKETINKERMKKYIEFLQHPNYIFKKQLIELLKSKNVDIMRMEGDIEVLYKQEKEIQRNLVKTTIKQEIDEFKKQLEELRARINEIYFEKEGYLKFCIETQLEDFSRFYLLYLVLEVKNGDSWERKYKSYSEFQEEDDDILLGRATQVLAALVYNESI